jgi:hypothetical protein
MDTEEAQALLGSVNGSGIGWLLIEHKQQLGIKTVKQVTLFYHGWHDDTFEPSWQDDTSENIYEDKTYRLLFKLEDIPAKPLTLVLRPTARL